MRATYVALSDLAASLSPNLYVGQQVDTVCAVWHCHEWTAPSTEQTRRQL